MGNEEWSGAAETTGLVGIESRLTAPTPTHVKLLYDDDALYLAFTSQLPEKARTDPAMTTGMTGVLRQTKDKFDSDVDSDDAVEINVVPELPADKKSAGGAWHRLVVNGLNTHYDYSISPAGAISLDWNPRWESASTLDAAGWHVEVRIPFASFHVRPPRPGDRWGLNFARIWQGFRAGMRRGGSPPAADPAIAAPLCGRVLAATAAPRVALKDWGPLADNRLALSVAVAIRATSRFGGDGRCAAIRRRSDTRDRSS